MTYPSPAPQGQRDGYLCPTVMTISNKSKNPPTMANGADRMWLRCFLLVFHLLNQMFYELEVSE